MTICSHNLGFSNGEGCVGIKLFTVSGFLKHLNGDHADVCFISLTFFVLSLTLLNVCGAKISKRGSVTTKTMKLGNV